MVSRSLGRVSNAVGLELRGVHVRLAIFRARRSRHRSACGRVSAALLPVLKAPSTSVTMKLCAVTILRSVRWRTWRNTPYKRMVKARPLDQARAIEKVRGVLSTERISTGRQAVCGARRGSNYAVAPGHRRGEQRSACRHAVGIQWR